MAQIRLKLALNKISSQRITRKKFNIGKFTLGETRKKFEEELKESLDQVYVNDLNPSEHWNIIKNVMLNKGENILGLNLRNHVKEWITEETWNEINRRKIIKQKINNKNDENKLTLLAEYSEIHKRVKRYAGRDKQALADKFAHKAQLVAETNNSRELYQITKRLAGKPFTSNQAGFRDTTRRLLVTPQN